MSSEPTIPEAQREDLVAYLDGELDESRSTELERTLADSEGARREANDLQRSFDLLDLLPIERASAEFTAKTLTAIQAEETVPELPRVDWSKRARMGAVLAGWVAGLSLVAVVAFLSTHSWVGTEADRLVQDLPVIENLDAYAEAGSVEFLVKLRDSGLLDDLEGANVQ